MRRVRISTFKYWILTAANARVKLGKPEGKTSISETKDRMLRASVDGNDMRIETTAQKGNS